jgi:putative glutamine amidotransferase
LSTTLIQTYTKMTCLIGITGAGEKDIRQYRRSLEKRGASVRPIFSGKAEEIPQLMAPLDGILFSGEGGLDPSEYGEIQDPTANLKVHKNRDSFEILLLKAALDRDMPVLAICRGMHLLNMVLGGRLIQDLPRHKEIHGESAYHEIYVSPGSKLAAIMSRGGFLRVNSRHHQGLRNAQRAPLLLASAYSLPYGLIEALESPAHQWVIAVQCHPEREDEVHPSLLSVLQSFVERAEETAERR